jgi:hypothetical protein
MGQTALRGARTSYLADVFFCLMSLSFVYPHNFNHFLRLIKDLLTFILCNLLHVLLLMYLFVVVVVVVVVAVVGS